MAEVLHHRLDFNWLELLKTRMENLAADPTVTNAGLATQRPGQGVVYWNTASQKFRYVDSAGTWNDLGAVTTESIQDIVGAMVSGGTESGITVSYDDPNGRLDFTVIPGFKAPVDALATSNVASLSGLQTVGGWSASAGDRVLLTQQSTVHQNGIWVVQSGAWTRPTDYDAGEDVFVGVTAPVTRGTSAGTLWSLTSLTGSFGAYSVQTFTHVGSASDSSSVTTIASSTGANGTANGKSAPNDHRHGWSRGTPVALDAAAAAGTASTLAGGDHVHPTTGLVRDTTDQTIAGIKTFSASPVVPTPTTDQQAANKVYVDNLVNGLAWKEPVRAATTGPVTLAGGAPNVIDGVTLAVNDRVLAKDQTNAAQNGIYVVQTLGTGANGTWVRTSDADSVGDLSGNSAVSIAEGTTLADSIWHITNVSGDITPGTTNHAWSQLPTLTQLIAGAGLLKTNNTIDVNPGPGITTSGDFVAVQRTDANGRVPILGAYNTVGATQSGGVATETITHNLNTQDVLVQVDDGTGNRQVVGYIIRKPTVNTVQIVAEGVDIPAGHRVVIYG